MLVSEVTWVNPSYLHTSSDEALTSCQHCPHLLLGRVELVKRVCVPQEMPGHELLGVTAFSEALVNAKPRVY